MVTTEIALDEFTRAYVECALWAETDDKGNPLDANYGLEDISPETLLAMIADCKQFQTDNYRMIAADLSRAGFNFWLTRNHHGAGFWDGDYSKKIGQILTDRADEFGECSLYVGDDTLIYS
jgi:hypothetical protein